MLSRSKQRRWIWVFLCWGMLVITAQAEPTEPAQTVASESAQAETSTPAPDEITEPAQKLPVNEIKAVPTPEEDYQAAIKAVETRDSINAVSLFKRAADAGHKQAQARYADYLKLGQLTDEALRYYRISIKSDPVGQYGLGTMYEEGEGVKRDFGVARFLFELAAEQGHQDASFRLAEAYLKGQAGLDLTDRQSPQALAAIRRAAGHGHLRAFDALEVAYRTGKFGITADAKQADVILAITNKMRGIVVKEKKKSALFKFLKGDPEEKNKKKSNQQNKQ